MGIDVYINQNGGDFSQWKIWIGEDEKEVLVKLGATYSNFWTTLAFSSIAEARDEFNRLVKAGCVTPPTHEVLAQTNKLIRYGSQTGSYVVGVVHN